MLSAVLGLMPTIFLSVFLGFMCFHLANVHSLYHCPGYGIVNMLTSMDQWADFIFAVCFICGMLLGINWPTVLHGIFNHFSAFSCHINHKTNDRCIDLGILFIVLGDLPV